MHGGRASLGLGIYVSAESTTHAFFRVTRGIFCRAVIFDDWMVFRPPKKTESPKSTFCINSEPGRAVERSGDETMEGGLPSDWLSCTVTTCDEDVERDIELSGDFHLEDPKRDQYIHAEVLRRKYLSSISNLLGKKRADAAAHYIKLHQGKFLKYGADSADRVPMYLLETFLEHYGFVHLERYFGMLHALIPDGTSPFAVIDAASNVLDLFLNTMPTNMRGTEILDFFMEGLSKAFHVEIEALDRVGPSGHSPLLVTAFRGMLGTMARLLMRGFKVGQTRCGDQEMNILHAACGAGKAKTVDMILRITMISTVYGEPDWNEERSKSKAGMDAMMYACSALSIETCRALVECRPWMFMDPKVDEEGRHPLNFILNFEGPASEGIFPPGRNHIPLRWQMAFEFVRDVGLDRSSGDKVALSFGEKVTIPVFVARHVHGEVLESFARMLRRRYPSYINDGWLIKYPGEGPNALEEAIECANQHAMNYFMIKSDASVSEELFKRRPDLLPLFIRERDAPMSDCDLKYEKWNLERYERMFCSNERIRDVMPLLKARGRTYEGDNINTLITSGRLSVHWLGRRMREYATERALWSGEGMLQ